MIFFLEVLIGGLLFWSYVFTSCSGFVLIYKASGFLILLKVLWFFAALSFVGIQINFGLSFWPTLMVVIILMIIVGVLTEKFVLRPLVNQPQITLFMATIGLTFFLEGLAQLVWGTDVHPLDIGIEDAPIEFILDRFDMVISAFDLFAAIISGTLVVSLAVFFQVTKIGRALRAVADDHQAALSIGIPLKQIWAIVWSVAGFVALVAGLMWGSRNGVQFALTFVALKALPVLIIGGFDSVLGAILGGLIIGALEKLAEVYIGPMLGGGIEGWFAYVAALLFPNSSRRDVWREKN